MAKGGVEGLDAPALRAEVERALGAMDEVRRIKLHLTNAAGGIEQARAVLEGMAERVRAHLAQIAALVDSADAEEEPANGSSKGVGSARAAGVCDVCSPGVEPSLPPAWTLPLNARCSPTLP